MFEDEEPVSDLVFICVDESHHATRAFDWFYEHHYREDQTVGIVHIEVDPEKHRENHHPNGRHNSNGHNGHNEHNGQNGHEHNGHNGDKGTEEPKHYDVMKKSTAVLHKFLHKCSVYKMKVKIFSKSKHGTVGQNICELINEHNPSLIVVGQRGISALQRTLFGSVSEHLLHHAHCPVLMVPPTREPKHK